ncbi:hypothetical protein [Streptomyces sp. NPDC001404]|uniref:hypothetical protein n=1 Tax=Streptomyces sp. NPDC001404 TaxID=3364571 RepID=UPI003691F2B0
MKKFIFRWFGWARALLLPTPTCTEHNSRPRQATPVAPNTAKPPEPTVTLWVTAHGIDLVPRREGAG